MGLFKTIVGDNWEVALWRIDESVDELLLLVHMTDSQRETILKFPREARQKEKLICAHLVSVLTNSQQQILYRDNGSPYVEGADFHISITHTKGWIAVQVHRKEICGIDIEYRSDRVLKIAHKFVSSVEMLCCEGDDKVHYINLLWCAKEALYKIAQRDGVDFIEHLRIDPFVLKREGVLKASVLVNEKPENFELQYIINENWYLVYKI